MKSKKYQYENFKTNVKLVLSLLWAAVLFLYIYGDYFELYVPEKVADLWNAQIILNTPYKLLCATTILTPPLLMIFLSLLMRLKWNRVLNISLSVFLTLFALLVGVFSFTEWRMFYVMLAFWESIITSIIIWKTWHWSKSINNEYD